MARRWPVLLLGLAVSLLVVLIMENLKPDTQKPIRVAFGSPWKTLHPGEQHTLVGDLVLSNQFEALVGINDQGRIIPLGAKSWKINEDYTRYEFIIDTEKTFSDGSKLSAKDYKKAWEMALQLDPKSNNSSLLDVMYKIKGFEDFKSSGEIKGIEVASDESLVINFKSPFRMALDHLAGNRFAAYKQTDNRFIGTGKYEITASENDRLAFSVSPLSSDSEKLDPLEGVYIPSKESVQALLEDKIEVFGYARGADIPIDLDDNLEVLIGQDALHETIYLNRQKNRLFEDKNLRRAFQFLMHEILEEQKGLIGNPKYWSLDEQIYLPLQTGRIDAEESKRLISTGEQYLDQLRDATKAKPINLCILEGKSWLKDALTKRGLTISEDSKQLKMKDFFKEVYKDMDCDVTPFIFSVALGDPDGIYHALGASGAILSPMIYSEEVGNLLETGREIIQKEDLDSFYQKVTRKVLEDVPFVHVGFSKAVAIYRKDKIQVFDKQLRRNEGHLHIYRWK